MNDGGQAPAFLTAEWRHLVMLNYEVDPAILAAYVPRGTMLGSFAGRCYVSLVAFRFLKTRVRNMLIPCHANFDEINLRFYVERESSDDLRRGVVFVKEVVPRRAIAAIARWVYNENYVACPTRSTIHLPDAGHGSFEYRWQPRGLEEFAALATVSGQPGAVAPGSLEEFITEHYWGYAAQRDGGTVEYRVDHPRWQVWTALSASLTGPVAGFYGPAFGGILSRPPLSAFVAAGSDVTVRKGRRLGDGDAP